MRVSCVKRIFRLKVTPVVFVSWNNIPAITICAYLVSLKILRKTHGKTQDNFDAVRYFSIEGYNIIIQNRDKKRGRGIALYLKDNITVYKYFKNISFVSSICEQYWLEIKLNNIKYGLGVTYRAPSSSTAGFLDSFETTLSLGVNKVPDGV